ncbi:hypothetical protein KSF78_0007616 [Schistosoma japonicum]|nr:hypothetical protein KSF78_0007616 [Schistosoma japonicum]KAH8861835.1 hypothetical protein KSF78_0007616 [Schistosoma japonicum]
MLIIYPDSIDRLQVIDSVKSQLVNAIQKYFDTTETRITIGVEYFKIQLYINNNDVTYAIHEWKTNMIPIVYHLEDSEKNLQMIHYAKLAQKKFFQINLLYIQQLNDKMISLIPDFLIYLKQLQLIITKNQLNIINLKKYLTNKIHCIHDIKEFNQCLQSIIGQSFDSKGLRCHIINLILQILNDIQIILSNLLKQFILPLNQITPGCETLQQINKKKMIKNLLKNLLHNLQQTTTTTTNNNNNNNNNNNHMNSDEIPINLQYIIRNENLYKYGWMLCLTTNLLNKLKNIDYIIDEYFFQFNYTI